MKRIRLATLEEAANLRPPGYLEACLAPPAEIRGQWVLIPDARYSALRLTYAETQPSLFQRAGGLIREVVKWKEKGFRIAHWKTFLMRSKACKGCPFSVPGIFHTCGRCGCTRAKLWLETARCPENRWRV